MTEPTCALCDDTGFESYDLDGMGYARPCACGGGGGKPDPLASAGVPERERGFTSAGLNEHQQTYRDRAAGFVTVGDSVILMGPSGRGKTGIAVCLMRDATTAGKSIAWCHVSTWLRDIRETFDRKDEDGERMHSEASLVRELIAADVAVVDDLGAHRMTDWTQDMIFAVVNGRDSSNKATVYTTNLPMADVERIYGERVSSRLARCVKMTIKDGPDRRRRG